MLYMGGSDRIRGPHVLGDAKEQRRATGGNLAVECGTTVRGQRTERTVGCGGAAVSPRGGAHLLGERDWKEIRRAWDGPSANNALGVINGAVDLTAPAVQPF